MEALDKEFEYYKENKEILLSKYENKFIVIVGNEVVGVFDDNMKAIRQTMKNHKLGTFLVQQVTKEDEVHRFYSPLFSKKNAKSA